MTPADIGLLKASLLSGSAAVEGYAVWRKQLNFESVPYGHQRLLPLLDKNLSSLGISDPLIQRFRGIRRFFWVQNLRSLSFAREVFEALQRESVPFVLLKGAALVAECLDDRSLRPMDDVDVLIRREHLADVVRILAPLGLLPERYAGTDLVESEVLRRRGSWQFKKPNYEVDIHWHALHLDLRPQADDDFWEGSRPSSLDGLAVSVLDPADQLLQICAHASQAHAGASAQYWPADAAILMRRHPDLSYRRLIDAAGRRQLSVLMADALTFLRNVLELPVPDPVLSELRTAGSLVERVEIKLRRRAARATLTRPERLLLDFQDFSRSDASGFEAPLAKTLRGFARQRTGAPRIPQALLLGLQAALGYPASMRRMLGRDKHRLVIGRRRLPRLGESPDLTDRRGNEAPFVIGWSGGEPAGRWTEGREAVAAWLIEGERGKLSLAVDGFPLLTERAPSLTVEAWANDSAIAEWRFVLGGPKLLPARLEFMPRAIGKNSDLLIVTFVIRSPRSPHAIGLSDDPRRLGLHVTRMVLSAARPT